MDIRKKTARILFISTLSGMLLTCFLHADTISMRNGDRLSGQVMSIDDKELVIKTSYAPQSVTLPLKEVADIHTDNTYRIKMNNGDTISGRIQSINDGAFLVQTTYEDNLRVPIQQIYAMNKITGEGDVEGTAQPASENNSSQQNQNGTAKTAPGRIEKANKDENGWDGSISVGGNRQTGNTDRTSASVEVSADRKTASDEMSLLFRYNYAEEEGDLTARAVYGERGYKYNLSKRLYWLLSSSLMSDEFRDLDLRTTAGLGFGYRWVMSEPFSLSTEAGLTYISRNYETSPDETNLAGRLSARIEGQLSETVSYFEDLTVYPSLEGGGHLLHNEVGLKSQLTEAWLLKISHVTDYDSDPPNQLENTDTTLRLGLGYSF